MFKSVSFILLLCVLGATCNRIYPWGDPYLLYPNNGYLNEIQLFLSLENPLPQGHVMRVQFPFSTALSISSVSIYPQTSSRGNVVPPTSGAITGSVLAAATTSPFNIYLTFSSALTSGTSYVLRFTLSTSPTDVGWLGYIQLETMSPAQSLTSSTAKDTPITYDLNNAFAPVELFSLPGLPTFIQGNIDSTAQTTVQGATYVLPVKFQLSNDFWFWPTFEINWSGSDGFQFSNCLSVDSGVDSSKVTPMASSQYSCSIDMTNKKLLIKHNAPVLRTQTVAYNITVTNPSAGGATTLSLKVYHRYNYNLTDYNGNGIYLNAATAPTAAPSMTSVRALLSWGIDRTALTTNQRSIFQLTASGSDTTAVFQGVRFYFKLSGALVVSTYQVQLQLCSTTANCLILENSIDHNLGSAATCKVTQSTSGVFVNCANIASLPQDGNYLGVRVWLSSTNMVGASNYVADSTFGAITISKINTDGATYSTYIPTAGLVSDYLTISATQTKSQQILLNQNGNGPMLATPDPTTWGYVYGTSGQSSLTTGNYFNLFGGLFVSSAASAPDMNVALFTGIRPGIDWTTNSANINAFGSSVATASGNAGNLLKYSGIDILMNPNLWDQSLSTDRSLCAAGTTGVSTDSSLIKPNNADSSACHCWASSTTNWVRLRWIYTGNSIGASNYDSGVLVRQYFTAQATASASVTASVVATPTAVASTTLTVTAAMTTTVASSVASGTTATITYTVTNAVVLQTTSAASSTVTVSTSVSTTVSTSTTTSGSVTGTYGSATASVTATASASLTASAATTATAVASFSTSYSASTSYAASALVLSGTGVGNAFTSATFVLSTSFTTTTVVAVTATPTYTASQVSSTTVVQSATTTAQDTSALVTSTSGSFSTSVTATAAFPLTPTITATAVAQISTVTTFTDRYTFSQVSTVSCPVGTTTTVSTSSSTTQLMTLSSTVLTYSVSTSTTVTASTVVSSSTTVTASGSSDSQVSTNGVTGSATVTASASASVSGVVTVSTTAAASDTKAFTTTVYQSWFFTFTNYEQTLVGSNTGAADTSATITMMYTATTSRLVPITLSTTAVSSSDSASTSTSLTASSSASATATAYAVTSTVVNTPRALAFFWPGFVKLKNPFVGTSLRADYLVPDYYGALYTVSSSVSVLKTTSNSGATDLGEIGGATLASGNITVGQRLFWSQYLLAPQTVSASSPYTSPNYANIQTWVTGWTNGNTNTATSGWDSNNAFSMIRVRGNLSSATDFYPSSAKIALFFAIDSEEPQASNYQPLAPIGASSGMYACFQGTTAGKCTQDRLGRVQPLQDNSGPGGLTVYMTNYLDYYEIISTDQSLSPATSSLSILTKFYSVTSDPSSSDAMGYYRVGFLPSSGLYYIAGYDTTVGITSSSATVTTTSVTCDTTTNAPLVGPTLGLSSYFVSQSIANLTMNYQAPAAVATTNGFGAITWCSQWNFKSSTFAINTSSTTGLESTVDKCTTFNYTSDASSSANWYCIYCPVSKAATAPPTTTSTYFTLNNFMADSASNIPKPTMGMVWNDVGSLVQRSYCTTFSSAFIPSATITGTASGSSYVQLGQKATVSFVVQTGLTDVTSVVLEGRNLTQPGNIDSSFPQSTLDTNAEVWLINSQDTTVTNYIKLTGASISGGSINIPISGIPTAKLTRNNWQFLIWGLNGIATPANATAAQFFAIKSYRASLAETSVAITNPRSDSLIQWSLNSGTLSFTVNAPQYTRPILNSYGSFRWDFSMIGRNWYYTDVATFDMSAFATSAINSIKVKCRITDTQDNINQNFSSCTISNTTSTLTINPIQKTTLDATAGTALDFGAQSLRVYVDGVIALGVQTLKTVNGKLMFGGINGGSTTVVSRQGINADINAAVDATLKAFPTGYPSLTKQWLSPNVDGIHVFNLTSSVQTSSAFRITVEFPIYYNPGLTTRSTYPYCTVNDQVVDCNVAGPRSLVVTTLPQINANSSIILKVSGVIAPQQSATTSSFWIQINSDGTDFASSLVYGSAFADSLPVAQIVTPLHVNWMNTSTTLTRSLATYTWTFNPIGVQDSTTSQAIHVVFPGTWTLAWGINQPTCYVLDYANQTIQYTKPQSVFGDIVMMNLTQTMSKNRIYNLVCDNMRTPDREGSYPSQEVQIRIVAVDGSTIYQQSAPSVHNVNFNLTFSKNPNLQHISWVTNPSTFFTPLKITRGTYGPVGAPMTLRVSPANASKAVELSFSPSIFQSSLYPLAFAANDTTKTFQIGCALTTPLNRYGVPASVNETTAFSYPDALFINVSTDPVPIDVSLTQISLLVMSNYTIKSLPVKVDTSRAPPFTGITVTPIAPSVGTNVTVSPASYNLTKDTPYGSFVFQTTSATISGEAGVWTFGVSGNDAVAFQTPASVTVSTVGDVNGEAAATPILALAVDTSDQNKATSKILSVTVTKVSQSTVYVGCRLAGNSNLNFEDLADAAIADEPLSPLDPTQSQYETWLQTSSVQVFTMSGLKPNKNYQCQAFVTSVTGHNSTMAYLTFRTASNGITMTRYTLSFPKVLFQNQTQALLCAYVSFFNYTASYIRLETGEYCGYTPLNVIATTSFYVYVYPLDTETGFASGRLLQTVTSGANLLNTNSQVAANLALTRAGAPTIQSIAQVVLPPDTGVSITLPQNLVVGETWIYVPNITLSQSGWINMEILHAANATAATSPYQIQQAAQANISAIPANFVQAKAVFYNSTIGTPVSVNFTSYATGNRNTTIQPGTKYLVQIAGSNDDVSMYANFTPVSYYTVQTVGNVVESGVALFVSAAFVLMAMLMLTL